MKPGESFTFSVKGNPTTGYTWNVRGSVINDVFSVQEDYSSEGDGSTMGCGGTYKFTVTAEKAGKGCFWIFYSRVWE